MVVQTVRFTWTKVIMATFFGAANVRPTNPLFGTGLDVHLYTGNHQPTPDDVPATYTPGEANFTGYAAAAPPFPVPGPIVSSPNVMALTVDVNWIAGVIVGEGNNITGYWVTDSDGNLVGAELFAQAIPIVQQYDSLLLTLILPLSMVQAA